MNRLPQGSDLKIILLLGVLCLVTYWPAFDNQFISDDYVLLERVESWRADPFYLFSIPPEHVDRQGRAV